MAEKMLTKETLPVILAELRSKKDVACTYDFKERFGVSLAPLAVLGIVQLVRSKIPTCGEHCNRYQDCHWSALLQSRKSKSLYRFTKKGFVLASSFEDGPLTEEEKEASLVTFLEESSVFQLLQSLQRQARVIPIEVLVHYLLINSSLSLDVIRSCFRDILDLLQSLGKLEVKEGLIV